MTKIRYVYGANTPAQHTREAWFDISQIAFIGGKGVPFADQDLSANRSPGEPPPPLPPVNARECMIAGQWMWLVEGDWMNTLVPDWWTTALPALTH